MVTNAGVSRLERQAAERLKFQARIDAIGTGPGTLVQKLYAELERLEDGGDLPPPWTHDRWVEALVFAQTCSYMMDRTPKDAPDGHEVDIPDAVMAGFVAHAKERAAHIMSTRDGGTQCASKT